MLIDVVSGIIWKAIYVKSVLVFNRSLRLEVLLKSGEVLFVIGIELPTY